MISITYTKLCAMPPPTETPISLKASISFYPKWNPFPFYSMYKFSPLLYHVFYAMVFSHLSLQIRRSIYLFFLQYSPPLKKRRNLWINTRIYALRKDDNEKLAHPDLDDMIYAAIEFSRLQHLSLSDIYAILC